MKSKLMTAILLLTLVFSLTACGRNSDDSQESSDSPDTQTEELAAEDEQSSQDTADTDPNSL